MSKVEKKINNTTPQLLTSIDELTRGCTSVYGVAELTKKLSKGETLRVKLGADPSSPDLHLGHYIVLKKLRQFQEQGHMVDFIIGDFTAMIGDPTGKSKTRPMLTKEEVVENAQTYRDQIFLVLLKEKTNVVFNSEWSNKLTIQDVIRLTQSTTLAQILERDDFMKRYKANTPISLTEFLYPLLQGIDSIHLKSDVELGGTDQTFNLLLARDLQKAYGVEPQSVLTLPLLEGLDGVEKMSKSLGNAVGLQDTPTDMFGKIMSIPDSLILRYFSLVLNYEESRTNEMKKKMEAGENPKNFKESLAREIVEVFFSKDTAKKCKQEFSRIFVKDGVPDDMATLNCTDLGENINLLDLVMSTNAFSSKGEVRRLIVGGGVSIAGKKLNDVNGKVSINSGDVLKIGKRVFFKLEL